MSSPKNLLRSSIGQKLVMAVTGLILLGFVLAHMAGNLQVYLGPGHLDAYGAALRRVPALLWGMRATLLLAVVLHAWAAWATTRASHAARPVAYRQRKNVAGYASHTMRWGGVTLALFVVYHLLHFTTGHAHPQFVEGAVHHNFVSGFRNPYVSGVYVLAMVALGLHLWHGAWSMLQTLGLSHPRYDALRRTFASVFTAVVVLGNLSFPLAVLAGVVTE
jgi:succinate dehydrogenase / fumarate reductase cytochrome b subunit